MADKRKDFKELEPEPVPAAESAEAAAVEAGVVPPIEAEPGVDARLAEVNDRYLRLAAEFDNFRKRTGRERSDLRSRAQGDLVAMLIDALDDLGRVAHLDPATAAAGDVIAGVELVERKVLKQLELAGLERIAAVDVPFDPNVHEAILQVPAETPEQDHTVAAVFQVGYRFGGLLLRAARVQVRIWSGETGAA